MAWSREETIGREEMRRIQLGKWQKFVSYVYAKNPVYRKKMDEAGVMPGDIRSLGDVARLPFTAKAEIRDYCRRHAEISAWWQDSSSEHTTIDAAGS